MVLEAIKKQIGYQWHYQCFFLHGRQTEMAEFIQQHTLNGFLKHFQHKRAKIYQCKIIQQLG